MCSHHHWVVATQIALEVGDAVLAIGADHVAALGDNVLADARNDQEQLLLILDVQVRPAADRHRVRLGRR